MPIPVAPALSQPISDGRFPHGEVITVVNRAKSGVDAEGNDVFGEVSTDYIGAYGPAIGFESTTLQDQVQTQPGVYLPFVAVVDSYSRVIARGVLFEVDGTPAYWSNPFSGEHAGCHVPLKRVSG